jgi:hypothetical protein
MGEWGRDFSDGELGRGKGRLEGGQKHAPESTGPGLCVHFHMPNTMHSRTPLSTGHPHAESNCMRHAWGYTGRGMRHAKHGEQRPGPRARAGVCVCV